MTQQHDFLEGSDVINTLQGLAEYLYGLIQHWCILSNLSMASLLPGRAGKTRTQARQIKLIT
jgi:hypothetical protein